MQQDSKSPRKQQNIDLSKKYHYYFNKPYHILTDSEQSKNNLTEKSDISQLGSTNKNLTQSHYFPQPQQIFKDLRSISNNHNTQNHIDINHSFVFQIRSKNHIQNETIQLENQKQIDKDRQAKDIVRVLHLMKKRRQEFTLKEREQNQSRSPRQLIIMHQSPDKSTNEKSPTEKSPGKIIKLPSVHKKHTVITVIKQSDRLTKKSRLEGSSIGEDPFQVKMAGIQQFILSFQCKHLFYVKQSLPRSQTYYIEQNPGNDEIIRELMKNRWWWCESNERTDDVQFYWSERSNSQFMQKQKVRVLFDDTQSRVVNPYDSENYEEQVKFAIDHKLTLIPANGKIHNHIEINQIIGFKKNFLKYLNIYTVLQTEEICTGFPYSINISNLQDPKYNIFSIKYKLTNAMWIIKPGEWVTNGQVMKICYNTKQVQDFILTELKNQERKYETFIIQQYIKPLLYYKRKFDIYCYLLITQLNGVVRVYFFEEGFARTSSKEYNENDSDPLIHFTNSHIQKESKAFSLYEPGNKLSFAKLQEFFIQFKIDFYEAIIPQLKKLATHAFKSVFSHLLIKDHNFEILGLNYLIDSQFKPWLIEISLNPTFNSDCQFQKHLITQMLDNSLNISLDLLYPPPQQWPSSKRNLIDKISTKNQFEVLFDSRFDSEKLLELFQKLPQN